MKKRHLLFSIIFSLIITTAKAVIRDVPVTYATIQLGLDAAAAGDTVLVQPGTYVENLLWPATSGITLLSAGDTTNTTIQGTGANFPVIRIVVASGDDIVIKGFRIIDGKNTTGFSPSQGTGISILSKSNVELLDLLIHDNISTGTGYEGGGIYMDGSTVNMENLIIRDNAITGNGDEGAGIYATGSTITGSNVIVKGNSTTGTSAGGAGIYVHTSTMTLSDFKVNNNIAGTNGPEGYGILVAGSTVFLTDGEINGNSSAASNSPKGAGIALITPFASSVNSTATLTRVKIQDNYLMTTGTAPRGAGIFVEDGSSLTGVNLLITGNVSPQSATSRQGAAIYLEGVVDLMNSTIADNHTSDGSVFPSGSITRTGGGTLILTNCILWNPLNSSEISTSFGGGGGSTTVTYSDVRGGHVGVGNFDLDPIFVGGNDYHLQATSPCIDMGTPTGAPSNDLDKLSRDAFPDMGAYENNGISCNPFSVFGLSDTSYIDICQNGINSGIAVIRSDSSTNLTYLWDDSLSQTDSVAVGLSPGTYNVTITDTSVSCDTVITITISAVTPVSYDSTAVSICQGDTINIGGIDQTTSGVYNDTLSSIHGCDSIIVTTLTVDSINTVTIQPFDTICSNQPVTLTATGGGTGVITWYDDVLGSNQIGTGTPLILTNSGVGTHTYYVSNEGQCSSAIDSIVIESKGVVAAINVNPISGNAPLEVFFGNGSTVDTGIVYVWSFGDGNVSNQFEPTNTYTESGGYTASLIVSDGICSDTAFVVIEVSDESRILIPNVFTPNGDNQNDLFKVELIGLEFESLEIYNRWGVLLFETTSVNEGWDGVTTSGTEVSEGTYFFILNYIDINGVKQMKKGTLTLLR